MVGTDALAPCSKEKRSCFEQFTSCQSLPVSLFQLISFGRIFVKRSCCKRKSVSAIFHSIHSAFVAMSCLTFVRCSPDDSLVKPFFIQCGEVLDIAKPWSLNEGDLQKLTINQMKTLITDNAVSEFKPVKKEDYVKAIVSTWDDTINYKSMRVASSSEDSGDKPPHRSGGGGGYGGGSGENDGSSEPDGSDDDGSDDGDFSGFSGDDKIITVYVDTRAMMSHILINPSFKVKTSWAVRYLKFVLYGKYGFPPNVQRFVSVGGATIFTQRSFQENKIRDGQTLVLLTFGEGGVKRTAIKEKDESKIIRLKQRVRSDVREVEVREVEELIENLEELKDLMIKDFTIQSLLGDAEVHTLKDVLDLIPTGLSGKTSLSRMASIIHKLLPSLKSLQENGLATCKDTYQHIYHNFMTQYAENFHAINTSDATLNHSAFKEAVQGAIEIKSTIEKHEVKEETKKEFEKVFQQEIQRIRQEEAAKATEMAKKMAEDYIKSAQGSVSTPMETG